MIWLLLYTSDIHILPWFCVLLQLAIRFHIFCISTSIFFRFPIILFQVSASHFLSDAILKLFPDNYLPVNLFALYDFRSCFVYVLRIRISYSQCLLFWWLFLFSIHSHMIYISTKHKRQKILKSNQDLSRCFFL